MKISTFFYVLRQGFANIRRNILFSLASLGTIISCLFLFGIIYAVVVNFQSGMQELEKTVTISVFFDEDASDETIQLIGEQIRTVDYVETMDFISADEAWDKFADQNYDVLVVMLHELFVVVRLHEIHDSILHGYGCINRYALIIHMQASSDIKI